MGLLSGGSPGGFYSFDLNGKPTGDSALSLPSQFAANLGLGQSGGSGTGGIANIMQMLAGAIGNNNQQQRSPTPAAPRMQGGSGANMQNIYQQLRNLQQQMTVQPPNNSGSFVNNIGRTANPYFPGIQQNQ